MAERVFDVRDFGARGDGLTLDTPAINAAIDAAAAAGGGRVVLAPGRYLSFSIQLRSRITLELSEGAILEAADPARHDGQYDAPEPNPHDAYQDFGHSHWHNSLIWGEDIEDVVLLGPGLIHGLGLTREGPGAPWSRDHIGDRPLSMGPATPLSPAVFEAEQAAMVGLGNKAVAIRNGRNIVIRDLTVLKGGHFAFLLTGVDGLLMDGLRIDTDRDGIDLDCVREARLSNLRVNTPNDDAIVLKTSFALGERRSTERVQIMGCRVSGYDMGTLLDGTFGRTQNLSPDLDRVTGRIKLGTESNGDFRDIEIADCQFERSRGLAIETVDGGVIEDIVVRDIVMREVTTAPIFLRLGDRRRGPEGTTAGALQRVSIRNLVATGIDPRFAATLAGLPDHPIEDVRLSDIHLTYGGGGTADDAGRTVPELPHAYPEPSMFGVSPAHGLYARHVRGLTLENVVFATETPDARPDVVLDDVV
ncbi:rhamnogalacturonidase [Brevundimonas subvibrioides]|uniref:Glycoside hydrolase family protein n=1 Tax=Brevundimonas subvibrioides (strain ATCC 15264 / DSM 4735 / LMG 14903 / NBRC 16000 / CB 81) TaxID=633149 RepID=D9QN16_BRESC|nr:glycosyl hydrolase family 28-related protein [Brevundimonas subvibrioides]ADL02172.1 glycoside hydrolase family protein [Brevundimonas subvibrioides ATCC 15264]